jgi:hypothetical protein
MTCMKFMDFYCSHILAKENLYMVGIHYICTILVNAIWLFYKFHKRCYKQMWCTWYAILGFDT